MAESKKFCVIGVLAAVVAVIIMIIALVATSLEKLDSFEVAISYDTVWKKLGDKPKTEGLHTGPPGFEFIKFPSVFKTVDFGQVRCLNMDGVPIYLDVVFQYQARANDLRSIVLEFKDHEGFLGVLKSTAISVIHEACSLYNTTQFQSERGQFQESLRASLRTRYEDLRCDITDLQVKNIQRPSAYESAIRAKESARENIKVARNEEPIKITQATTKLRESKTQASITVDKAESDARILLNKANTEAASILAQYQQELNVYKSLIKPIAQGGLGFGPEGFISYMATRVLANSKQPIYFGMKAPAKASYFP